VVQVVGAAGLGVGAGEVEAAEGRSLLAQSCLYNETIIVDKKHRP